MDHCSESAIVEDRYYRDGSSSAHNLSFAGCGFLGVYHIGVGYCIMRFAPHLYQNKPVAGVSVGAIAAVCLICEVNIAEALQYLCELIDNARSYVFGPFDPRCKINEELREGLSRILPSDAHLICSGRLSISLTCCATRNNIIVDQFNTKDELITAVLCSAFIPVFSGFVPLVFKGQPVMDGGLSNNLLRTNRMTITVSPFAGDADICPLNADWCPKTRRYLTSPPAHYEDWISSFSFLNTNVLFTLTNLIRLVHIVWPMTPSELASLAAQGYADALRYLTHRGLIACRLHRAPQVFPNSKFVFRSSRLDACRKAMKKRSRSHVQITTNASTPTPPRGSVEPLDTPRRYRRRRSSTGGTRMPARSGAQAAYGLGPVPDAVRKNHFFLSSSETVDLEKPTFHPTGAEPKGVTSDGIPFEVDTSAAVMGLYRPKCMVCRQEMAAALASVFPAFFAAIITGDVQYHRPRRAHLTTRLASRTRDLVSSLIGSTCHQINWLTSRLIYPPILVQLNLLICLHKAAISRLGVSGACLDQLTRVVSCLEWIRDKISNWRDAVNVPTGLPPGGDDQLLRYGNRTRNNPYISNTQCEFIQPTLATRLQSAMVRSTYSLTDLILQFNSFKMPSAADCGFDLLSPPSPMPLFSSPFTAWDPHTHLHRTTVTSSQEYTNGVADLPTSPTTESVGLSPVENGPAASPLPPLCRLSSIASAAAPLTLATVCKSEDGCSPVAGLVDVGHSDDEEEQDRQHQLKVHFDLYPD